MFDRSFSLHKQMLGARLGEYRMKNRSNYSDLYLGVSSKADSLGWVTTDSERPVIRYHSGQVIRQCIIHQTRMGRTFGLYLIPSLIQGNRDATRTNKKAG